MLHVRVLRWGVAIYECGVAGALLLYSIGCTQVGGTCCVLFSFSIIYCLISREAEHQGGRNQGKSPSSLLARMTFDPRADKCSCF